MGRRLHALTERPGGAALTGSGPGCYAELRDTLLALAEHTEVVGFDVVAVNPQLDGATGIPSHLAAHRVVRFLGRICDQPRWRAARDRRAAQRAAASL